MKKDMSSSVKELKQREGIFTVRETEMKRAEEEFSYSHMTMVSKDMPSNPREDNYLLSLYTITQKSFFLLLSFQEGYLQMEEDTEQQSQKVWDTSSPH